MTDSAVVDSALVDAALRKSGLISNECFQAGSTRKLPINKITTRVALAQTVLSSPIKTD